jgi:hypothetical protein
MRIQRQSTSGNIDTLLFAAASGNPAAEVLRVSGNGNVGIGTFSPAAKLHVEGGSGDGVYGLSGSGSGFGVKGESLSGFGVRGESLNGYGVFGFSGTGLAGYFVGDVAVLGNLILDTLDSAGTTALCLNASNRIATCSSSLRYKTDVRPFAAGLDILSRLHPIAFTGKQGAMRDLGLAAEEVEKVEPLLVTHNAAGQVEGVKYDRINVLLINAVKQQQAQIDQQRQQLTQQSAQIKQQQAQIEALQRLVCQAVPTADLCKP